MPPEDISEMFELRVLNGLHQGAALPLVGEQWLIGADDQHDLALYDPGVAALHCRLSRTEAGWSLDAEDSLINDDEGHALTSAQLKPNQAFALGNVWLCLAAAETAWPNVPHVIAPVSEATWTSHPEPAPAPRAPRLKLLCAALAGLLLGVIGTQGFMNRAVTATENAPSSSPTAPAAEPVPGKVTLNNRADIRRRLSTLLSERLLTDVTLEDSGDGLVLKGRLNEEALQVYRRMLEHFNARYATAVPVQDQVVTLSRGLPFAIAQIISGNNAHLVTADGHRMYIGDHYNGLRLTHIDDQRIQFDGDQHIEVPW